MCEANCSCRAPARLAKWKNDNMPAEQGTKQILCVRSCAEATDAQLLDRIEPWLLFAQIPISFPNSRDSLRIKTGSCRCGRRICWKSWRTNIRNELTHTKACSSDLSQTTTTGKCGSKSSAPCLYSPGRRPKTSEWYRFFYGMPGIHRSLCGRGPLTVWPFSLKRTAHSCQSSVAAFENSSARAARHSRAADERFAFAWRNARM
jgi:hypothetical protein